MAEGWPLLFVGNSGGLSNGASRRSEDSGTSLRVLGDKSGAQVSGRRRTEKKYNALTKSGNHYFVGRTLTPKGPDEEGN